MKTKAKKFSRKLLALFLAVVMGLTCFTGAISASAATSKEVQYRDSALEYNSLGWRLLSDEQAATAVLDYLDDNLLPNTVAPFLENALKGIGGMYNAAERQLEIPVVGNIKVHVRSVDEIIDTIAGVESILRGTIGGMAGDAQYIHLDATAGMSRSKNTSCEIIAGILGLLRNLSFNETKWENKNTGAATDVLGRVLRGELDLGGLVGIIGNFINGIDLNDIYRNFDGPLGVSNGFEDNFVYNVVKALLLNNTGWFGVNERQGYIDNPETFVMDDVLLGKLSTELLQKISVYVTYDETIDLGNGNFFTDNSETRKEKIDAKMAAGKTYEAACADLGYDSKLVYSEEEAFKNNILLFKYNGEGLVIEKDDTLASFAKRALTFAWNTVLKDTVKLVHVNNDVNRGYGKNFDNLFYYWGQQNLNWNRSNPASNYTDANIKAWAQAVYTNKEFNAKSVDEFLDNVKNTLVYDRTADDTEGAWDDIDATQLFGKLRYSPLADFYYNIETGPINLYFLQTGTPNLDKFFETDYNSGSYPTMVSAFNDCLIAAVKDVFVKSDYVAEDGSTVTKQAPFASLETTTSTDAATIAKKLVSNATKMIQYTADSTDANILKAFYTAGGTTLTETNLETAMMPMLAACIGEVNLGGGKLSEIIHPEDWDACKDAEALAYLALREYLSYILPNKEYDGLGPVVNGRINATLEGTIMPMARDALGYILESYVPLYDVNNQPWKAETSDVNDKATTIFTLLNSVVCYYANDYDLGSKGLTNGVAALFGLCDPNTGRSTIVISNGLWDNLDRIINHLLPVVGELQYGVEGASVNTEDFIMGDIVNGFLEIATEKNDGMGGVSNFIYRLLTMCNSKPIAGTNIVNVVYDFLGDLINGIFGNRYASQPASFDKPIPDAKSTHPFDDLLQRDVIAGTGAANAPGALQKVLIHLAEAAGFGSGSNKLHAYPDSFFRGAMFAVQSIAGIIPGAIPTLSDNTIEEPTVKFDRSVITGYTPETNIGGTISVTNNIAGLNNAYLAKGEVVQQPRYMIRINEAYYYPQNDPESIFPIDAWTGVELGAYETATFSYTTDEIYFDDTMDSNVWEAKVVYDVITVDGDPVYSNMSNLVAVGTQLITQSKSWSEAVYDNTDNLIGNLKSTNASAIQTDSYGNRAFTSPGINGGNIKVQFPEYIVSNINDGNLGTNYRLGICTASEKSLDGIYSYDSTTVTNDNGSGVAVNEAHAKVLCDDDGNIINPNRFDYSTDGGHTWIRNKKPIIVTTYNNGTDQTSAQYDAGFSNAEILAARHDLSGDQLANFVTRPAAVFTLAEARSASIVQAAVKNADGTYEAVYLKSNASTKESLKDQGFGLIKHDYYPYRYDTLLGLVNSVGPTDGYYINVGKLTVEKDGSYDFNFLYTMEGAAPAKGVYPINLAAYAGSSAVRISDSTRPMSLVIADTTKMDALKVKYDELAKLVAGFEASDFADATAYNNARTVANETSILLDNCNLSAELAKTNAKDADFEAQVSVVEQAISALNEALVPIVGKLYNEISLVREGMNENNYSIITYNKLVDAAHKAENSYQVQITYVDPATGQSVEKTLPYDVTIGEDYKDYRDNEEITITSTKFVTDVSMTRIKEYINDFNFYRSILLERGYLGYQLEEEIKCASGNAYSAFAEVTRPVYDETGALTTVGTVKATGITPRFGSLDAQGNLVNIENGKQAYTEASWNEYVSRLADAVAIANIGNSDSYPAPDYYNPSATYEACVTKAYEADKDLQKAEIALEAFVEDEPTGFNVSGNILTAVKDDGTSNGKAAFGEYTITVYSDAAKTNEVGSFKSVCDAANPADKTNTFNFTLPNGTYYATVSYDYALTRDIKIVVNGADVAADVVMLNCNFDGDTAIGIGDATQVLSSLNSSSIYMDMDGDGSVGIGDATLVLSLLNVNYSSFPELVIQ